MIVKTVYGCCTVAVLVTAGPLFHLRQVEVTGDVASVEPAQITAALEGIGRMTTFSLDVDKFAVHISKIPTVRTASATINSRNSILVKVEARKPIARSGSGALIDIFGDFYYAPEPGGLPIYLGPIQKAPEFAKLSKLANELFAGSDLSFNQISWHDYGWQILLNNGWQLQLGTRELRERLTRLVTVRHQLAERFESSPVMSIDLRYPTGLAVANAQLISNQQEQSNE